MLGFKMESNGVAKGRHQSKPGDIIAAPRVALACRARAWRAQGNFWGYFQSPPLWDP